LDPELLRADLYLIGHFDADSNPTFQFDRDADALKSFDIFQLYFSFT
jgi:hypothetical protein